MCSGQVSTDAMSDAEIRQLFRIIDEDDSGDISIEEVTHLIWGDNAGLVSVQFTSLVRPSIHSHHSSDASCIANDFTHRCRLNLADPGNQHSSFAVLCCDVLRALQCALLC